MSRLKTPQKKARTLDSLILSITFSPARGRQPEREGGAATGRVAFVDVKPQPEHDEDPRPAVMRGLMALDEEHDVLLLHNYDPAPLRDLFAARGLMSWAEERQPHDWYIYFYRPSAGAAAAAALPPLTAARSDRAVAAGA